MPAREPRRRAPTIDQSTLPIIQWPRPATRVSGTACAKSEPTTRTGASLGYRKKRTATPKAPAPTEHSDTNTPSTAPKTTVIGPEYLVLLGLSARANAKSRMSRRKKIAKAATISVTPIEMEMIEAVVGLCFGSRDSIQIV